MNWWLENMVAEHGGDDPPNILVDCGYVNHPKARSNADKLIKHLPRRSVLIAGFGRVLVRVPKTKIDLLNRFRSIEKRRSKKYRGYCNTTHVFGRGPQFDLKYAS